MIGVIPSAGKGERFGGVCKALVMHRGQFLIENPLNLMNDLGLKKVIIIQHDKTIEETIGKKYKNLKLKYVQQKEQTGISDAILKAEKLVKEDMLIIFCDIIYNGGLKKMKLNWDDRKHPKSPLKKPIVMYGFQKVKDKNKIKKSYGIAKVCFGGFSIIEKPKDINILLPILGLGIYMANKNFFKYLKKTSEITNALNLVPSDEIKPFELKGKYVNVNTKEDLK